MIDGPSPEEVASPAAARVSLRCAGWHHQTSCTYFRTPVVAPVGVVTHLGAILLHLLWGIWGTSRFKTVTC